MGKHRFRFACLEKRSLTTSSRHGATDCARCTGKQTNASSAWASP